MYHILIVEDDPNINLMIRVLLTKNNYQATSAFSGTEALLLLEKEHYDLILLDLMLPGLSGEEIMTQMNQHIHIPIICVSAKDDMDTKLSMIRDGADDFITKPFHNEELIVRIGAVIRRSNHISNESNNQTYHFKDLIVNSQNHTVTLAENPIELTVKEYEILNLLIQNPNKVFSKQNIFESVWSEEYVIDERAVTVHVSNLRNKLIHGDDYIKTVWGIGYKMQDS